MKLFTVGPVEMYPETLAESALQLPYFRTGEFSQVMLRLEQLMLDLTHAPQGSRSVFLTASGTGAMEAVVVNCLSSRDLVLTIDGGAFGQRFVQLCRRHGIPQNVLHLDFGERLTRQMLDDTYQEGMTALLVNLHETSVGQLYNLDMLGDFCKQNGLLLIVDAISAFLADPIDMEKAGIDVLIVSSQKALALAPGISAAVLSPRAIQATMERGTDFMYFDFRDYLMDGDRGQTPFTPAVGILLTMRSRLERVKSMGLDTVQMEIHKLAVYFREKVKTLPVQIPDYPHSNALTPIYFPQGNAQAVYDTLCRRHQINVTPSGGALADHLLRVGHIGNLTTADHDRLLEALAQILK